MTQIWVALITTLGLVLSALIAKWKADTAKAPDQTHSEAREEITRAATDELTDARIQGLRELAEAQGRQIAGLVDTVNAQSRRLSAQNTRLDQQDAKIEQLRDESQALRTWKMTALGYIAALVQHIEAGAPPPPPAAPPGI